MTTSIKSFILFFAVILIAACANQTNKNAQSDSKPAQPEIINGTVMAIENGKDGYTAEIQTKNKGTYAALVSIINVGGPENYQRFNIGDKVTLKGMSNYADGEQKLMVQKIIRDKSAVPGEFTGTSDMKPAQSKTIAGRVTTIEFGKDGYTAAVQTLEQGTFDALVSIVNLGGPDNYQKMNIGDRVVLTGTPNYSMSTPMLKVEKIDKIAIGKTQLLISSNAFRGITVGDKIAMHKDYIQKEQLETGEGTFEIYRIKDFNNNPAGYLMPDPNDESVVGDITVETPTAATIDDIKVGSMFGDLNRVIPNIEVHGSEVEGRTYATANNISYRLAAANFSYDVDVNKIPASTKIMQIIVNRGYENTNALNDKYSKIQSNEYCWLVNDKLPLYTKPNTNSPIQGNHFRGEVLSVLDSKVIDGAVWVNVEYKLTIKTGYEDQFADGQVMSSGEPTGWIGGVTSPIINCK